MDKKTVPVVVTLSGTMDLELAEGMTAQDIQDLVKEHWNIDPEQVHESFVVMSDMITGASMLCQDEEDLTQHTRENSMLRVVLPLAPKG